MRGGYALSGYHRSGTHSAGSVPGFGHRPTARINDAGLLFVKLFFRCVLRNWICLTYASALCTVRLVSDCMSFWQIMFELVRAWRKCRAEKLKAQKFSFGQMGGTTDMSFEGSKPTTYGQERAAQSDFALQSDPAAGSFA